MLASVASGGGGGGSCLVLFWVPQFLSPFPLVLIMTGGGGAGQPNIQDLPISHAVRDHSGPFTWGARIDGTWGGGSCLFLFHATGLRVNNTWGCLCAAACAVVYDVLVCIRELLKEPEFFFFAKDRP